jgi:hypothetical protein
MEKWLKQVACWYSEMDEARFDALSSDKQIGRIGLAAASIMSTLIMVLLTAYLLLVLFSSYNIETGRNAFSLLGLAMASGALIFGLINFMSDRSAVLRGPNGSTFFKIIWGVVMGLVLSIPLELKFSAGYIKQRLEEKHQEKNAPYQERIESGQLELEARIQTLRSQMEASDSARLHWANVHYATLVKTIVSDELVKEAQEEARRIEKLYEASAIKYETALKDLEMRKDTILATQRAEARYLQQVKVEDIHSQYNALKEDGLLFSYFSRGVLMFLFLSPLIILMMVDWDRVFPKEEGEKTES